MVAGELGCDYVAFGEAGREPQAADPELIAWWQEMMLIPAVAQGAASLSEAVGQAEAGADFILLDAAIWDDVEGPAAAVAWMERQLGA